MLLLRFIHISLINTAKMKIYKLSTKEKTVRKAVFSEKVVTPLLSAQ
ncbi:hypothetical protein M074_1817 [Bacteroides fragilis str. DS-166]|nr:hypothetical protein M074_1817 [Bacteroides fragilis str. DS-166]